MYISAIAGELKERRDVTHEMIDKVVGTEGQICYVSRVGHGPWKPHHIDTQQKE